MYGTVLITLLLSLPLRSSEVAGEKDLVENSDLPPLEDTLGLPKCNDATTYETYLHGNKASNTSYKSISDTVNFNWVNEKKCNLTSQDTNCGDCDSGRNCKNDTWYKFKSPYNVLAVFSNASAASAALRPRSCNGIYQIALQLKEKNTYFLLFCKNSTCNKTNATADIYTCPTFNLYKFHNLTGGDCGGSGKYEPISFCLNDTFYCSDETFKHKADDGSWECLTECPANTYSSNKTCVSCPENSSSSQGSSSIQNCTCIDGTYNLTIGQNYSCVRDCPKDMYGEKKTCNNCLGHETSLAGSTTKSACKCVAGYENETATCKPCSAGSYNPDAGGTCKECAEHADSPQGATTCSCMPGYNATQVNVCKACPESYYKSAGNVTCVACATNKTSTEASTRATDCVCKSGFNRLNKTDIHYDCVAQCPKKMVAQEGVCVNMSMKILVSGFLMFFVLLKLCIS